MHIKFYLLHFYKEVIKRRVACFVLKATYTTPRLARVTMYVK